MRTLVSFLLFVGTSAQFANANELCASELDPVYKAIEAFDGTKESRNALLKRFHRQRQAAYSVCEAEDIRKFEEAYRSKMGKGGETKFESWSFFPKPRKTLDLGEVDNKAPRIPASIPFRQQE